MATVIKIISILKRFYHRPNSLGFNLYFQLTFNAFLMDLPNSFFIRYRTAIKRTFALVKENRYHMEISNRYKGFENVTTHAIEHDIALTQDIIFDYTKTGKLSPVLNLNY